ncbi:MAG: response regulator, partial [Chloroflexota bacterium]
QILGAEWQKTVDLSSAAKAAPVPEDALKDAVGAFSGDLKRVVVIEDNVNAARLMSRILESRKNSEVYMAHNGAAGLEIIREIKPDLVITDLMMPEVDGFSVIESMRGDDSLKKIPIVVVSAKDLTAREKDFLDSNTDLMLQKGSFIDDAFMDELVKKLN